MPKKTKTLRHIAIAVALAVPQLTFAALPQAQAPSRGEGTNIIQTLQNYGYDGAMLLALLLLAAMFLGVAAHAYGVYHEIHEGKKKWRDLGATAAVGVCIIGVGIFLATRATNIL
ncbi:hypothetical protein AvCA_36220 [Azotobacter vinelandii CA]|uniref:Integrating conjugative element membrane protein n=2 Tax=Azotobacter vinelandii TaxID=354 RepID=C1DRB1_AZOVD|nr:TIGR03745 family integrating conjugative element membrane protein [Azotobacter vinelandii]ACO79769.1 conserved hypothetical protein [Azotobacter vinelandii DJ]AGK14580.1 hypothetical protein AvCA_36220 [Azotobacter vinelandii CA]AGK21487.1 hypothetical protein AvCA6_36220 [Azotobacter vinelandii CA6]SFY22785.1 integrating conjugative element membrane protein, PFL_4702 family [Azotobacter vinelandii]GLK61013.1 integrating conjugative element membrane protein [Azotobacter vinelandii]